MCDHGVFLLLYIAVSASLGIADTWLLATAAGCAHAVQSALYEGERGRFHRRLRGDSGPVAAPAAPAFALARYYDAVAGSIDRLAAPFDRLLRASPDPRSLGQAYGRAAVPPLRLMIPLSANMRVVVLTLACLAGDPRLFWWYELVPCTLLAIAALWWHRRTEARIVDGQEMPIPVGAAPAPVERAGQ